MTELKFLKTLIHSRAPQKLQNRINFNFFPIYNSFVSPLLRKWRLLLELNIIKELKKTRRQKFRKDIKKISA